ncbi:MAG TPA: sulfotransferase [Gaiellaceae bacterium]|nr:sulfotransferase [Gaiellaceae bacterium]
MLGWRTAAYGVTAARTARRGLRAGQRRPRLGVEDRLVFVVGSPRSGTTFTGGALGTQPGWVDLGEVPLLKAAVPRLLALPVERQAAEVRRIVERVRTLGLVRGLRGVEQNPETAYVLAGALEAYPRARAVHVIRDGRDVVCSLLERGWLRAGRTGGDDAQQAYGAHARFWVEPERREEFEAASEARRAAWAWRRYVSAARAAPERTVELRYEALVGDPHGEADRVADALGAASEALRRAFSEVHGASVGRWRRDLTAEQVADVEAEAGALLDDLGYA